MTAVDLFLWWSGTVVWLVAGTVGLLWVGQKLIDWSLFMLGIKRDFLMFVFERRYNRRS